VLFELFLFLQLLSLKLFPNKVGFLKIIKLVSTSVLTVSNYIIAYFYYTTYALSPQIKIFFFFFSTLGTESRASCLLGKHSYIPALNLLELKFFTFFFVYQSYKYLTTREPVILENMVPAFISPIVYNVYLNYFRI
jgi:hypothetical protein